MNVTIQEIQAEETYDLRHRVMWPDHPVDFIKLPEDENGVHLGLFVSGKLVSIISLFVNGKDAQFRKFAIEISEQGKGYGSQLLSHLLEYAQLSNIERIWCNARVDKTAFYKKFGFIETDTTYIKGGIDFIVLERISK
ncbi:MAG: GNAT family N-acetyltransferase [Balneolaceae bacterium]